MNNFITGGISGAITDPYSDDAIRHAEMYYEEIRKNHSDVTKIAHNTSLNYDQVLLIKQYLFFNVHDLEGGIRRFDASFEIAQSWQRLSFDPQNIKPHDLTLLSHELTEIDYVNHGMSQKDAHIKASEEYPYAKECKKYYEQLDIKNQDINIYNNRNSGAICIDDYNDIEER